MPELSSFLALFMLLLPFLGFALLSASSRLLPRNGDWVAIALLASCTAISGWLFQECWVQESIYSGRWEWFTMGEKPWHFAWHIDRFSALMLLLVSLVTTLVMVFSTAYMKGDPNYGRYYSYLCLFSGAMMGLVLVDHLLLLYVFWELVGLASYLLIGFWQHKPSAIRASKKAFLVNRVGDAGFLIGLLSAYQAFGTLEVSAMVQQLSEGGVASLDHTLLLWAGAGISLGAMAKSAQLPFSIWLPDAMEGPTPVSALLHAATMVAAGVYLLARVSPLLPAEVEMALLFIGGITALFGAFSALFQTDLKKVLAYSTISQLGYMFMGIGSHSPNMAMFHLLTHAFFKASLFLAAGAVIHALHEAAHEQKQEFDAQDMRLMGGLRKVMPKTFLAMLASGLALAGLPFFSGFLSKDALLAGVWRMGDAQPIAYIPLAMGLLAAFMTAFYVGRLLFSAFFGEWRNRQVPLHSVREVDVSMYGPVLGLALGSIWLLFSLNPLDAGHGWFLGTLLPGMAHDSFNTLTGVSTTFLGLGGLFLAYRKYGIPSAKGIEGESGALPSWSLHALFLDRIYLWAARRAFVGIGLALAWWDKKVVDRAVDLVGILAVVVAHLASAFDRYVIDGLVRLVAGSARGLGQLSISVVQQGKVQGYIAAAIIGLLLLWWMFI